jgi:hypothetical protein
MTLLVVVLRNLFADKAIARFGDRSRLSGHDGIA